MNKLEVIAQCGYRDQIFLRKQYERLKRSPSTEQTEFFEKKLNECQQRLIQKQAQITNIHYPDLPILAQREKIISLLKQNSVLIVAGETGSGKSTQLAKICLEAGFGIKGMIGHTQPRRIAAQSIAVRVADELKVNIGEAVGYKIRFKDRTGPLSLIKVATDGMLLSESQTDRLLLQYEVIIVDEAHERSLNIDILLGLLKKLISKRPELKVIITSATIQLEKFSTFFNQAPIIEVPGRQFPVQSVFIGPIHEVEQSSDPELVDMSDRVVRAVKQAISQGLGDILIFQSGEREIQETIEVLKGLKLRDTTILPLYARLTNAQQRLIFKTMPGRKIVVATNVAETSITVPNIRYVIDTGFHKISRYNYKNKLQRLEIEAVSWASHMQRKGRCGRVGPGIYYALFDEADLAKRPEFTDPEILRSSLAKVILNLLDLKITGIQTFPFIDPPNYKYIKDGLRLLHQLGAIDDTERLTDIGQMMAKIPIEPRLSRMLISAQQQNCLSELLVIVSALTINDPRETPFDKKEQARERQAQFVDPQSEFLSFIKLWQYIIEQKGTLTHKAFAQLCKHHFLSFIRVCEWIDLYEELKRIILRFNFKINQIPADSMSIHKAILTGLLDHIGFKEEKKEYMGARSLKFIIHPSCTIKKTPQWIVCAELFHTSQTFAKTIAAIEPHWVAEMGKDLIKKTYLDPHFDIKSQSVVAIEKSTLFGLEVQRKKVFYEQKNARLAKEIFIREALLEAQLIGDFEFYKHNQNILKKLETIANKTRYRHVYFNEEKIFQHYQTHLPASIASTDKLKNWLNSENQSALKLSLSFFISDEMLALINEQYPDEWSIGKIKLPIHYCYDLDSAKDGATLSIGIEVLPFLVQEDNSWLIKGWLYDKVSYDLRNVLRQYKHKLPTSKQLIDDIVTSLSYHEGNYEDNILRLLAQKYQVILKKDYFSENKLMIPAYLSWHYHVIKQDKSIMMGDDLHDIFQQLKEQGLVKETWVETQEKPFYQEWSFEDIPESLHKTIHHKKVLVYPAIKSEGDEVSIQYYNTPEFALQIHTQGIIKLLTLSLTQEIKYLKKQCTDKTLQKQVHHYLSDNFLYKEALVEAALFECFIKDKETIRTRALFLTRLQENKNNLTQIFNVYLNIFKQVLSKKIELDKLIYQVNDKASYQTPLKEIDAQLSALFGEKFMLVAGLKWFSRYPIYIKAMQMRLEKYSQQTKNDALIMKELHFVQRCWQQVFLKNLVDIKDMPLLPVSPLSYKMNVILWKIEELRISHFAQKLGTVISVSKQKILKELE